MLLALRRPDRATVERNLGRYVGYLLVVVATVSPFVAMMSTEPFARPDAFFFLQGAVAGLLMLYVGLGRSNRNLVAYVLVVSAISMTVTVFLLNGLYPFASIKNEALYSTGSIASYEQASAEGGFYYFVPIGTLTDVAFSMVTGIDLGLPLVESVVTLTFAMLSLLVLTRRYGLEKAAPAAMLVISTPQLSYLVGRTLSIQYAMLTMVLISLLATKLAPRQTVGLLGMVILVMVLAHPVGPIALIAAFAVLRVVLSVTKRVRRETVMSVGPAIRLLIIITAGYWFTTYIYTLIVTKATHIFDSTQGFIRMLIGGNSRAVLGATIPTAIAPGYSAQAFWEFAYAWAAPIAIGGALVLVWLGLQAARLRKGKSLEGGGVLSTAFELIAVSSAIGAFVLLGTSFAAYALGSESGQYAIPSAYLLLLFPAAMVFHRLLDSRKLAIVAVAALVVSSVVLVGTYSPDWAPLEHQNFGVEATISNRNNFVAAGELAVLTGQGSQTVYLDYDLAAAAAVPSYKSVRSILSSVFAGNTTFGDYANSTFVLQTAKLANAVVYQEVQGLDVIYSSNDHFGLYIP